MCHKFKFRIFFVILGEFFKTIYSDLRAYENLKGIVALSPRGSSSEDQYPIKHSSNHKGIMFGIIILYTPKTT